MPALAAVAVGVATATVASALTIAIPRHVFVTSASGPGDLASWTLPGHPGLALPPGIAAGDAICQTLAADAGLTDASGYVAWLSDGTDDAFCRVLDLHGKRSDDCGQASPPSVGGSGRSRLDGTVFDRSLGNMLATSTSEPLLPVRIDETAHRVFGTVDAWTGTATDGTATSLDCSGWTDGASSEQGATGSGTATLGAWSHDGQDDCSANDHLICFEKGAGTAPTVAVHGGRRAFVTSVIGTGDLSSWPDAGGTHGLAAGDAICRARAAAGGLALADSFKAWLSVEGTDASSRFQYPEGAWVRMDGLVVASGVSEICATSLDTAIDRDELLQALAPSAGAVTAWTGTGPAGSAVSGFTCSGWTDASGGSGLIGDVDEASDRWTFLETFSCAVPARLYCLSDADPSLLFADGFDSGGLRLWTAAAQ